ncbi:helix-turn-helix transcriptional regulator [Leeuwenhoekiella sp. NPDC079379]|uniref:helix-turn-helix transcriptional regulator n=1 Tax=Leeuwenhoekiella sp. NPDC079379 TaxID=3364122 RepID=UPI0037C8255F
MNLILHYKYLELQFIQSVFMPINKNAYIRYQVLDRCFSNSGRKFYWQDLLEEVNKALIDINGEGKGIGRTQLFKDISFMESEAGFSILLEREKDGKKVFYRYEDRNFSIKNSPLSTNESDSIKSSLLVLSRFKGLPQFEWVNELIPILNDKLGFANESKQVIYFDSNIDYEGISFIEPIFNAISNSRVLEIEYQDFKNPLSYKIVLHPYVLKQYNNRWFVFGLNEENNISFWNMALDRIQSINELDKDYKTADIDWEDDYFYDIIGVTRIQNADVQEIVLQFLSELAPYIQTKPIHPTQTRPKFLESGEMVISIKVIPNYELERLILSYGEKVKVISPKSIRDKIQFRIQKMLIQYDE